MSEFFPKYKHYFSCLNISDIFSWFEYFFLLTYFQNFPSTDVPLRFAPTDVLPRTYPRVKKNGEKKVYKSTIYPSLSFSEEILPKCPSTDVLSMFLPSEVLHRAFWHLLKKYAKHSFSLGYKYFEFFVQFFEIYKKFLKFTNFKMDLQTHRRVVSIYFEIQTYLIFMLTRLSNFQMI